MVTAITNLGDRPGRGHGRGVWPGLGGGVGQEPQLQSSRQFEIPLGCLAPGLHFRALVDPLRFEPLVEMRQRLLVVPDP